MGLNSLFDRVGVGLRSIGEATGSATRGFCIVVYSDDSEGSSRNIQRVRQVFAIASMRGAPVGMASGGRLTPLRSGDDGRRPNEYP